jgi:non-ribosomal peptide synthase protein (TIGR01720 family)
VLLSAPAGLDRDRLVALVQAVLDRHDMLRARLTESGDESWGLSVPGPGAVPAAGCVTRVDVGGLGDARLRQVMAEHAAAAQARLDPAAGVLVQVVWFDCGADGPQRVLWTVHHLAVDGVSWRIIVSDLNTAWDTVAGDAAAGGVPALPSVPGSFRGWARYLAGQAGDPVHTRWLGWWREVLATPDPLLGRRALDSRADTAVTGRSLTRMLAAQWTGPVLTRIPAVFYAGVNDVLLAALALAVGRWRDERGFGAGSAVLVDLEGHGRHGDGAGVDLSRTVGWFTSVHPVRVDPGAVAWDEVAAGGPALGEAVKQVKEQLRGVPGQGLGYGLLRYLNPRTGPVLAAAGTPQISFNYLGRFGNETATHGSGSHRTRATPAATWTLATGTGLTAERGQRTPAFHALDINAVTLDTPDGPVLSATWVWPDGLFDPEEVERLADLWTIALQGLVTNARRDDAGGHTPSDLTLSGLTQADIDGLEDFLRTGGGDE